ncbi:MAG: hypothetical protein IJO26_04480 [Clostridium sp.]|nr:hypothetical protein [Clostridium sp.]
MSKRKSCREKKYDDCCCEAVCCEPVNSCCSGNIFGGLNNCITPIIFLLIACGSGLLNNNCSVLIILLFLLCGGCFGNIFGGNSW